MMRFGFFFLFEGDARDGKESLDSNDFMLLCMKKREEKALLEQQRLEAEAARKEREMEEKKKVEFARGCDFLDLSLLCCRRKK